MTASATAFPPPRAAELGFTRVRPLIAGRSRMYPTSAGGIGRGQAKKIECARSPSPQPSPASGGGSPPSCGQLYFTSTRPTWLTRLFAVTGLPSGVTLMLRTMSPPPGIAQLWNFSVLGSKRTMVFGLAPDSLYQSAPLV